MLILIVSGTTLALSSEAQVDNGASDARGQTRDGACVLGSEAQVNDGALDAGDQACYEIYEIGPEAQVNDGVLDAGDQAYDDVMFLLYIIAQLDDDEFVRDTEEQNYVEENTKNDRAQAYDDMSDPEHFP